MKTGAIFDPTNTYRYLLWREWNLTQPRVVFVMLNPSTADADTNDATIRCCLRFSQSWGYGALEVVNLFALIATHPQQLKDSSDPIGQECDHHLLEAAHRADQLIVAWGNWGSLHKRDRSVLKLLTPHHSIYCVGRNRSGQPRHPLYLSQKTKAIPFESFEF